MLACKFIVEAPISPKAYTKRVTMRCKGVASTTPDHERLQRSSLQRCHQAGIDERCLHAIKLGFAVLVDC